jgi:hypothetical protein
MWLRLHVVNLQFTSLVDKQIFFIMFTLLILGKKLVKPNHFDVYLQPLVEELQQLWTGVPTYDM